MKFRSLQKKDNVRIYFANRRNMFARMRASRSNHIRRGFAIQKAFGGYFRYR